MTRGLKSTVFFALLTLFFAACGEETDPVGPPLPPTGGGTETGETGETADETGETADETGETTDETGETADETGETADETGETADETGDEEGEETGEISCEEHEDCAVLEPGGCELALCDSESGTCLLKSLEATPCDDEDACTEKDLCEAGVCVGLNPKDCEDGDQCTVDVCDKELACQHTLSNDVCDDGNYCTHNYCGENDCTNPPNTFECDDGDVCTTNDACANGACAAAPMACDDDNPCTNDFCDPELGHCVQEGLPSQVVGTCGEKGGDGFLEDTQGCITDDDCEETPGVCIGDVTELGCDDENSEVCTPRKCATSDDCVETVGSCGASGVACMVDADCPDDNPCLAYYPATTCDGWLPPEPCIGFIAGAPCDDSDDCTLAGYCKDTACVLDPDECADGDPCTDTDCLGDGGCQYSGLSGEDCDDGNACTQSTHCTGGLCVGASLTCDDGNTCTTDVCDAIEGCVFTALDNNAECDDGDACTNADVCDNSQCAGTTIDCNDDNVCTDDSCHAQLGCLYDFAIGECDDGDACTDSDSCIADQCYGIQIECVDENPCSLDQCDSDAGGCIFPLDAGAECDDGDVCTTVDACADVAGTASCVGSIALECSDDNPCTLFDSCHPIDGCTYTYNNGLTCDDGLSCTDNDICVGEFCEGTPVEGCIPFNCGDGVCSPQFEDCDVCPTDCAPCCGDGVCQFAEDCTSCASDCGVCAAPLCEDGSFQFLDVCGGDCDPTLGPGTCGANNLCVPTNESVYFDDPIVNGNGACGRFCSADFECSGDICAGTSGLQTPGICAKPCVLDTPGYCQEDESCIEVFSSALGGVCIQGGPCNVDDAPCADPADLCVTVLLNSTDGICLPSCFLQDPLACDADPNPEVACQIRQDDGFSLDTAFNDGTCAGHSVPCDPLAQAGCGASETCAFFGGWGFGGSITICEATGASTAGDACGGPGECSQGLVCHEGQCTSYCDPVDPAACGGGGCNDISLSLGLGLDTVGVCP